LVETNSTTTYTYERRNLVTVIGQTSAVGTATQISRSYDGYGQLLTETVTSGGSTYAVVTQTWDAAGRRASLNDASSTLPAPLLAYQHRADGLLAQITANSQDYTFTNADNGRLAGRVNPYRTLTVNSRDTVGRILMETQTVGGTAVLTEDMFWRANDTLNSYSATRGGTGGFDETRPYFYNTRGQLLTEGFAPSPGSTSTMNYTFDGTNPGLGVRLTAKIGTGSPAAWEIGSQAHRYRLPVGAV
jgi:YD repeat-containing protein